MNRRIWMAPLLFASLLSACHGGGSETETPSPEPTSDAGTTPTDAGTNPTDAGGPYAGLVFNEILAAGDPDGFELYNGGSHAIDLSGLTFSDDRTQPAKDPKAKFGAGTTLAPGAFLRVDVSTDLTGFAFSDDEEVALFTANGTMLDLVDWATGASPKGKSYGRFPNGTGAFKTLNTPTLGAANQDNGVCGNGTAESDEPCEGKDLHGATCQSQGYVSGTLACTSSCQLDTQGCVAASANVVINELTSSDDDRIELYNRSTASVDLKDWYVADSDYVPSTGQPPGKRYVLKDPLAAGQYKVLVKGTDHTFGIGKSGTLRLFNKSDQQVDIVTWPDSAALTSYCRLPNGTGDFTSCTTATFGAANQ